MGYRRRRRLNVKRGLVKLQPPIVVPAHIPEQLVRLNREPRTGMEPSTAALRRHEKQKP